MLILQTLLVLYLNPLCQETLSLLKCTKESQVQFYSPYFISHSPRIRVSSDWRVQRLQAWPTSIYKWTRCIWKQEFQTDTKYARHTCGKFNGNNNIFGSRIFSTWGADTANSVFGQFKGHNSGVPGGDLAGYRTWSRYYANQHIHHVW